MADGVFEHILEIIRGTTESMERTPKTFREMGEQARRDVLVTALNSHYRGKTVAEAFNFRGKTDILVRHEEKNLFIGECKFWSGVKGFRAAIEQLFRYAAWRDTKLALILFVREKGLTAIVESARSSLAEHEQFLVWEKTATESELRAQMSWPGDPRRSATLNVFFVHLPA